MLLEKVNTPEDIRKFSVDELKTLCAELRSYIISCCAKNPGHLGASLGVVEIVTALHYVYNTPKDKIVFDVGHQAYAHKILTGRREAFLNNRKRDGISGFPNRFESEYDAFGVGHSSTSISAALGLAEAAKLQGSNENVVAVIGDGALTGGLALEGLNNAGASNADLLVILNDNDMAIDNNQGALHKHLLRITTDPMYNRIKNRVWNTIGEGWFRNKIQQFVRGTKSSIVTGSGGDLFEALGFRYFGPIDGHDIEKLIETLDKVKNLKGPRIIHVMTVKGKGYQPAEENPTIWHAPGKFDPETGERIKSSPKADRYQDVFGQTLVDLAEIDDRVVGITPAMATGCGMDLLAKVMPKRFFDVGIEEEHAVTFSAGLAAGGMKPFCNIYSSFSQRAYDQIIHDVALQNLPVVLCFDRAGLVGEDGATHHGVFDMAAYRSVPNAIVAAPKDELDLRNLMYTALQHDGGPFIIRYPRGCGEGVAWRGTEFEMLPIGKGERILSGKSIDGTKPVAILCIGPAASSAISAASVLSDEGSSIPYIYNMRFVKPLDPQIMEEVASNCSAILTVEDGSLMGGLYGAVTEYMAEHDHLMPIHGIGIPDKFVSQDTQASQRHECGLDKEGILDGLQILEKKSQKVLEKKN
ncbi:MAG: 1-deoxy-D-xylulose-5-phosphate synthase [Bacteroidales bacterium]|nr:1-deoxy-D-xylulose-5-phosphate synthase [Bacteroidales bacterium]